MGCARMRRPHPPRPTPTLEEVIVPARNRPVRLVALTVLLTVAVASGLTACGGSGSDDPSTSGPTKQAAERLRDFGLTADQASCVVDEVGADTVVEATDLNAFADSQQYRDAAEACIDD